jgi:O-antigen ligase
LYLLGIGLLACMAILIPQPVLGLDQFYYPKEFALSLFACGAAAACAVRARELTVRPIDLALIGFLAWSALACLSATNPWWALRALGVTVAGLAIFWVADSLRRRGFGAVLTALIATAVVAVAAAALLEAYGVSPRLSVGSRAPGGILGNRNAMAHLLVLGLPAFLVYAVRVRTKAGVLAAAAALMGIVAALVLSRTRNAWAAGFALTGSTALGVWLARSVVGRIVSRRRLAVLAIAAAVGVVAAVSLPNRLSWKSGNPYLDSLQRILDLDSGSGRGRLLQYVNTLRIIRDHPLTGVGPGNWAVRYPEYVAPGDPTLFRPTGSVPIWRFPQGDWLGFAAEVGIPGLVLLLLAGWHLARWSWSSIRRSDDPEVVLRALGLQATLTGLAVIGALDPVLRTPAAAFLVFASLGTLAGPPRRLLIRLPAWRARLWTSVVMSAMVPCVIQSAGQLWAASLFGTRDVAQLRQATLIYPGDYLSQLFLAQEWVARNRCDLARPHIELADSLYPSAPAPDRLRIHCAQGRWQGTP